MGFRILVLKFDKVEVLLDLGCANSAGDASFHS